MKKLSIIVAVFAFVAGVFAFLFYIDKLLYSKIFCKFGSQNHCSVIHEAGNLNMLSSKFDEAEKLFKFACNSEFGESCLKLGSLFAQNQNNNQAKIYFKKSCEANLVEGCDNLASLYIGENDYERARPLLEISCENGFLHSCHNLGFLYLNAEQKNPQKAIELYTKSCEGGFYDSCAVLSVIFVKGGEIERNLPLALKFAQTACRGGVKEICPKIQDLQEAVDSTKLFDDLKSLDKELCEEEGDDEACDRLRYEETMFGF